MDPLLRSYLSGFAAKVRFVQLDVAIDAETKVHPHLHAEHHSKMTTSSLTILKYILCTLKGNTYRRFVFLDLCRVSNCVLVVRQCNNCWPLDHRRFRDLLAESTWKSKLFEETFCIAPLTIYPEMGSVEIVKAPGSRTSTSLHRPSVSCAGPWSRMPHHATKGMFTEH